MARLEQFQEVRAIARAHFKDPHRRVREVAGYRYRRSLDETFAFSTEGECLGIRRDPPRRVRCGPAARRGMRTSARRDGDIRRLIDMHWNYRVFKQDKDGRTVYSVREVYYDETNPSRWQERAETLDGDEDPDELLEAFG